MLFYFVINLSGQGAATNISLGYLLVRSREGIFSDVGRYQPGLAGDTISGKRPASPGPLIQKLLP